MNGSLLFEPSNSGAFLGGGIFYGYLDGITLVKTRRQGDGEGRAEDCMDRAEVMLPGATMSYRSIIITTMKECEEIDPLLLVLRRRSLDRSRAARNQI